MKHNIYLTTFLLLSILSSGCNQSALEISNYSINILSTKKTDLDIIGSLAKPIVLMNDSIVFLPDSASQILYINDKIKTVNLYRGEPCNSVQKSFGTCDSSTICNASENHLELIKQDFNNLSHKEINSKNTADRINTYLTDWSKKLYDDDENALLLVYTKKNREDLLIEFPKDSYIKTLFIKDESKIKESLTDYLINSTNTNVLVLLSPPAKPKPPIPPPPPPIRPIRDTTTNNYKYISCKLTKESSTSNNIYWNPEIKNNSSKIIIEYIFQFQDTVKKIRKDVTGMDSFELDEKNSTLSGIPTDVKLYITPSKGIKITGQNELKNVFFNCSK